MTSGPLLLDTAIEAARAAMHVAVERMAGPLTVTHKGFRDLVTEADFAAQEAAVAAIRARFPDAAILGEENLAPPDNAETVWVIDPIDGTTNYARRLPVFCASVGVVRRGQPLAGAVFDPSRAHLFTAERERGAYLNGQPIRASGVSDLSDALLALDWSKSFEDRGRALDLFLHIASACRTVRAIGSAALAMCYLAAGWVDLYFNLGLKPWDGAATQLILEEAGARVTNGRGEAWDHSQPDAFASNGHLHHVFDRHRAYK